MKQRGLFRIFLVLFLLVLVGCLHNTTQPAKEKPSVASQIEKDSQDLAKRQAARAASLEKRKQRNIDVSPVLPKYDPLDDHKISFSMMEEKLETVLYLLADTVGMNLMLDGKVASAQNRVTLNFNHVSAKTVLTELTNQFDLDYRIQGNIIRISTEAEQFFSLNFLDTNIAMAFDVGGDVLGGGGTETVTGLSGSVTIKGSGAEKANPYVILEEMITKVKSEAGILSINKVSGTLYIKDKPSVVKTVAKLITHFKEMLARQILIEARIIEVTLSSGYDYGIDWELLAANSTASSIELSEVSWDLTNGLVLDGFNSAFTFSSIITALETFGTVKIVSNPTIRAKHGSPAIISVGDSISYLKSVTVNKETNDGVVTETTEVEASTVFDGLLLGVIPFIEAHGKINLLINPVKSDVDTDSIEPETVGTGIEISLPKVGIKEISTAISINDGDTIVLGGLISSEDVKRDKDVPFLSKVPGLGMLFKNDSQSEERKELVIILNVKIL
ncbi:MAG: pilus (MSHA type) biogenesis protein MshL [Pseudomonadota bacterium]